MLDEHADLWRSQDIPHASQNKLKYNESRGHPISNHSAARSRGGTDDRQGVYETSYQRKGVGASRSAGLTGPHKHLQTTLIQAAKMAPRYSSALALL